MASRAGLLGRTQELLALMGSDLTACLLAQLQTGPATETQLVSQPVINRRLNALAGFRLVARARPATTGKRGRPGSAWRIASRRRLNDLERDLNRCAARLP